MKRLASIIGIWLLAAGTSFAQQAPPPAVIVTTGEGVVKRAPDRAWVSIAAESRARTAQEAQRLNTDAMNAVLEKIKAAGIPADAIQTTGYNLQPEFDYANGKQTLRGYVARNQVQVRVDALAKTGDVIGAAVGSGATNVSGVRFDLKDRDGAEREALRLAVQDARQRANYAATGAGVTIERVIRVEEQRDGGDMPRPIPMMAMRNEAAQASVPLEAGEIEVRSRVTLTVAIRYRLAVGSSWQLAVRGDLFIRSFVDERLLNGGPQLRGACLADLDSNRFDLGEIPRRAHAQLLELPRRHQHS